MLAFPIGKASKRIILFDSLRWVRTRSVATRWPHNHAHSPIQHTRTFSSPGVNHAHSPIQHTRTSSRRVMAAPVPPEEIDALPDMEIVLAGLARQFNLDDNIGYDEQPSITRTLGISTG